MIKKDYYKEYSELRILYKGLLKGNIELSDENKILKEEIERLNNRIYKAIEILERYNDNENNYYVPVDIVLQELKGEDKE